MSKRRILILTLLLLAGISVWLVVDISNEIPQKPNTSKLGRDYYMEDVISVVMDKSGLPKYRLTAKKLAHYPGDDRIELTSPNITLFSSAHKVWIISAEKGTLLKNKNEVQLTGDVILNKIRDNHAGNPQSNSHHRSLDKKTSSQSVMTISTQAINIFTDRRLASTDKAVTISTEHGKINAIGMDLYTDKQILELKSAVRGHYVSFQ